MEINTDGYQGRVVKSALVESNDPKKPKLTITLEVVVMPIFMVTPQNNLVINTTVGKPVAVTVELTNQLSDPVEITEAGNPFGDQAEVILKTIEAGRKYTVTLNAKAEAKFRWSGRVHLTLKGAPAPVYSMPAYLGITE